MVGIARKRCLDRCFLAASQIDITEAGPAIEGQVDIEVEIDLCPRYTARLLTNCQVGPPLCGCSAVCWQPECVPSTTSLTSPTM